jgi:hypothetical protein
MNTPEAGPGPAPATGQPIEELRRDVGRLHLMFVVALAALVLLSLSVNLFLLRQVVLVGRQAGELRIFVAEYQSNSVPVMNKFVTDLKAFARTHPDFAPALAKFGGPATGGTAAAPGPALALPPSRSPGQ